MYLKSIEIQGFKSFANKIRFDFHEGITGIVGPNGSGKSNVADAVRWVLGEQRVKQLRGSSMQDVIFAGTETRKPMGYAYVAITLDNEDHSLPTDYREVTVARRIFRSGESEYLLNGASCRLRDIQELFYDTGIGKEGYSIIGQGQIDKILSDKPEDRRELFDEAVGIVKFKRRKDTSLKKLNSEKENLVRINDILAELESQIPTLEKQSAKAKEYLKEREALKRLDVNLFLLENRSNMEELQSAEEKVTIAQGDLDKARAEHERLTSDNEALEASLADIERQIEETRNRITDASVVRSKLEGDIKVAEEQIRASKANTSHFRSRRTSVSQELAVSEKERDKALESKAQTDEELLELRRNRSQAQEAADRCGEKIEDLSRQAELGKSEVLRILSERATIKSTMASLQTMKEENDRRIQELSAGLEEAKTSEIEQTETISRLRDEFSGIGDQIRALSDRQAQIEEEIQSMKQRLREEDENLQAAQLSYHQEKSKLDALVNMTERYEGYGNSVRRVMQSRTPGSGIIGVVADLIKTDRKYETAIEVALGGNIQNIVVEDQETAKRMIETLKKEKAGRATFLPLSGMARPQPLRNAKVLAEQGVIGTADSLVECDERYRLIASSLLGRIVIVDTFDHAAAVNRKYGHTVRMVTLDGELFMPGGAISGGAFRNKSNLLGRRREMAELREKVSLHEKNMKESEQSIEDIKLERTKRREELEENRKAQQDAFLRQNTVRMSIAREQEKRKEARGSAEELDKERKLTQEKAARIDAETQEASAALEHSSRSEQKINDAVSVLEEKLASLREEEAAARSDLAGWDTQIEKLMQLQEFRQSELDRAVEEMTRRSVELKEIDDALAQSETLIGDREQKIKDLKRELADSQGARDDSEDLLRAKNEEKEKLTRRAREQSARREELSETIHALDKECERLSTRRERLQENIDSRVAYMWEEYEITLSDARDLRDETLTDAGGMKKEISQIRGRIKALGSVNVDAIEDYRALMERYGFLKGQHDDLVSAAESLEKIIGELDASMRRQFNEQFALIQKEFNSVFRKMFGGGTGKLELMEDQDVLEAGVRVIAQPPGKKLQNMNALSGGEKALTAIALLFAIQNLKPSPFCLLDEIEAALDESNIIRFAEYLHHLTEHTQFIVITHRRGTMEECDRLYGITMQEKGISTMVSVDLMDKEELYE